MKNADTVAHQIAGRNSVAHVGQNRLSNMGSAILVWDLKCGAPGGRCKFLWEGGWVFRVRSSIHPRLTPNFRITDPTDHGSVRLATPHEVPDPGTCRVRPTRARSTRHVPGSEPTQVRPDIHPRLTMNLRIRNFGVSRGCILDRTLKTHPPSHTNLHRPRGRRTLGPRPRWRTSTYWVNMESTWAIYLFLAFACTRVYLLRYAYS